MYTTEPVWIDKTARRRFSAIGFIMLMIVAIMVAVSFMLSYFMSRFDLWDKRYLVSILSLFPIYLTGVPLAVFFFGMMDSDRIPENRIPFRRLFVIFLICLPIMIGGNIFGSILSDFFSNGQSTSPVEEMLESVNLIDAVTIVILGPIAEEILCRKMIIDHTVRYGEKNAVIFSAICFGLLHRNLYQFFYAFGLGLVFGYLYLRSGRLRYSIGFHVFINFLGGIVAPFILKLMNYDALMDAMESGDQKVLAEVINANSLGMSISYAYLTAMGIGVLAGVAFLIIRWRQIRFFAAREELARGTAIYTIYLNFGVILFTGACAVLMVLELYS